MAPPPVLRVRFFALAALVLCAACPDEPRRAPAVGRDAVPIAFESSPSGAMVGVDGWGYGPTPITIRVEPGRHRVSIQKPGFMPHAGELDVRPGAPAKYEASLIASH